jgi:hypothetical protein
MTVDRRSPFRSALTAALHVGLALVVPLLAIWFLDLRTSLQVAWESTTTNHAASCEPIDVSTMLLSHQALVGPVSKGMIQRSDRRRSPADNQGKPIPEEMDEAAPLDRWERFDLFAYAGFGPFPN